MFKGTDLTSFDACYARFFSKDLMFGEIVLDLLNESDVFVPLTPEAFQITNHKYFTVKVLSRENIPVPVSSLADPAGENWCSDFHDLPPWKSSSDNIFLYLQLLPLFFFCL